jgi:hypothetical protein
VGMFSAGVTLAMGAFMGTLMIVSTSFLTFMILIFS